MKCPFGIPVHINVIPCFTEEEVAYINFATNSHEKLVKLLKDAQEYIRPLDPKYIEIEQALKEAGEQK